MIMSCDSEIEYLNNLNFDKILPSTKTFTVMTNLIIDIQKIFDNIPITKYNVVKKKRGRKKLSEKITPPQQLNEGDIINIKLNDKSRGVELKKKKTTKFKKWFRNSITIIIFFDKFINFKVCKNGTLQITGCKSHQHVIKCIKSLWNFIKSLDNCYTFKENNELSALIVPCMRNIDFSLGFIIDREKLNTHISKQQINCLLETSFGYTGVNIKIPTQKHLHDIDILKLSYTNGNWQQQKINYTEYLKILPEKKRKQKLENKNFNTFLIFHSGKVIMSGINYELMYDTFYEFIEIIKSIKDKVKEQLTLENEEELTLEEIQILMNC